MIDVFCSNMSKIKGIGITCKLLTIAQYLPYPIKINYGNGDTDFLNIFQGIENNLNYEFLILCIQVFILGNLMSFFGAEIPLASATISPSLAGTFISLNSEFRFDTILSAFQIYAVYPGNILLSV